MKTVVGAVVNGGAAGGGAETENSLQRMFEEWGKPKVLKRSRNPAAIAAAAMAAVSADADAAAAAEDAVGGNGNEHG